MITIIARRLTLLLIVFAGMEGHASESNTLSKMDLLSAVDIPLTPALIEQYQLQTTDLLEIIMSPHQSLYTRGRAIAALGMRSEQEIGSHLRFIIDGSMNEVLKQQAIRSLAKGWGRHFPHRALTILGDLLAIQTDTLREDIRVHFQWLQNAIPVDRSTNASR